MKTYESERKYKFKYAWIYIISLTFSNYVIPNKFVFLYYYLQIVTLVGGYANAKDVKNGPLNIEYNLVIMKIVHCIHKI